MGEPLQVLEGSDTDISRLFPKCIPRRPTHSTNLVDQQHQSITDTRKSDLNLNYVRDSDDDNDNFETSTITALTPDHFHHHHHLHHSTSYHHHEELPSTPQHDYDDSSLSSASRMSVDSATATTTTSSSSSSTPGCQSECHSSPSSSHGMKEDTHSKVPADADLSVVSAYCSGKGEFDAPSSTAPNNVRVSVLDSSYDESPIHEPLQSGSATRVSLSGNDSRLLHHSVPQTRRDHFRLRDSRIEAAGGRELFSQSRNRPARRRHEEIRRTSHNHSHHHMLHLHHKHHLHLSSQVSHQQQQQYSTQPQSQPHLIYDDERRDSNSSRSNSTSSHSSTTSGNNSNSGSEGPNESRQTEVSHNEDISQISGGRKNESPLVYETPVVGSTEVVFDDIGEWVARGLTVRGLSKGSAFKNKDSSFGEEYLHSLSDPDSDSDSEQALASVTKIGNVPIAEYEGSPRRYGPRAGSRHHNSRTVHLLQGLHHTPRPGFPRRVTSGDEYRSKEDKKDRHCQAVWEKPNPPVSDRASLSTREKSSSEKGHSHHKHSSSSVKEKSAKERPTSPREKPQLYSTKNYKMDDLYKVINASAEQFSQSQMADKSLKDSNVILNDNKLTPETINRPIVCTEAGGTEQDKSDVDSGSSTVPVISISTLTSTYSSTLDQAGFQDSAITLPADSYIDNFDYNYEVSETRKVLEEFFKDSNNKQSIQDFYDLEYTLKRQHGNSYVGQRLAAEYEGDPPIKDEENVCGVISENDYSLSLKEKSLDEENKIESTAGQMAIVVHENGRDVPDKHELEASRNFTLSPDTTSCDSGDVESDYSGPEAEGSIHSSSKGLCSTMPVLEDGLSSGEESEDVSQDASKCSVNTDNIHPLVQPSRTVEQNQQEDVLKPTLEQDIRPPSSTTYQRARSLDEQLCRGELPFSGPPIAPIGNSSTSISPVNSYSCSLSSPSSHHEDFHRDVPNDYNERHRRIHSGRYSVGRAGAVNHYSGVQQQGTHSPSSSTLSLMKKQITEIEREIALKKPDTGVLEEVTPGALDLHLLDPLNEKVGEPPPPPAPHPHRNNGEITENGTVMADSISPTATIGHLHSPAFSPVSVSLSNPQLLSTLGSIASPIQVAPHMVPGHPAAHDIQHKSGSAVVSPSRESVEAAIADIKQAIRRTKNLPLKSHTQERFCNDKQQQPVWVPRNNRRDTPGQPPAPPSPISPQIRQARGSSSPPTSHEEVSPQRQMGESSPSAGSNRSQDLHEEDDGDTDQETDRLLGQQRSDDTGFIEDKSWRRGKGRPVMPRYLGQNAKDSEEGGTNSNGSSPSTPIIQNKTTCRASNNVATQNSQELLQENNKNKKDKECSKKKCRSKEVMIHEPAVLIEGVLFRARYLGSTQLVSEGQPTKTTRMMQAEEAVSRIKAPDGEAQPSTEVDLFISTEKIMVLNTDLKEIMMDHALRTISYIADIGDLVVLMARRRVLPTDDQATNGTHKTPKMICHVFESDEAQFIAQSIGQAFQVAYLEFLKANGIEDHSFVKEMDYQEVLNSQEIFGDELQMFAKKELQKEVVVPKMKGEILGVVVVESGWGSMVPTVVIANLSPTGAAAKCGQLNIGDQIIAINGVSLVGLPLSTCQNYIKNTKYNTAVKLTVVPCPPVVEVKIRRPDTKYQLGFSVQNGVICSLLRGGIAERGGVRVGHRIIDINSQSVVAVPHDKIVNLLATSVGEIRMKTMPTSIFRLLTGQETPQYI